MKIEKKIFNYKEICEKFICFNDVSSFDYENLVLSLVEYLRNKYNLQDVIATFNLDSDIRANAQCFGGISISFKRAMLKKDLKKPSRLLDTFITIVHELGHIIDWRENEGSASNRDFIGYKFKALNELAKYYPEKKDFYENLSFAIYYNSRSETFARTLALKEAKYLVDDLCKMAQMEYGVNEDLIKMKFSENATFVANLDKKTRDNAFANKFARNFAQYRDYLEHEEDCALSNYKQIMREDLAIAKKDFEVVANDFLNAKKHNFNFEQGADEQLYFILNIPEFYDKNLNNKFDKYFSTTNEELSQINKN